MLFMEFFASVTSASSKNNAAGCCISFSSEPLVDSNLKPLDLSHGQCTWCGKYGHNRGRCPLLK